jgi:hypothetical protein
MFMKSLRHSMLAVSMLFVFALMTACSSVSFLPITAVGPDRMLGQRTVNEMNALAPSVQRSWTEVCNVLIVQHTAPWDWSETLYEPPCDPVVIPGANYANSPGYIAGLAAPLIQAGAIVGGAYLIGDGIKHSGSKTTNNNGASSNVSGNTNGNSNNANAHGGNANAHGGNAQGGQGGVGNGGQGGVGNGGEGGVGQGGQGGGGGIGNGGEGGVGGQGGNGGQGGVGGQGGAGGKACGQNPNC